MSEMKSVETGSEEEVIFTPRDVMLALRYDGNDEDIRFTQLDIGRCLRFLSPDERCIIIFYAAGYEYQEIAKRLNMADTHPSHMKRKFNKAIQRLTKIMNGEER